MIFNSKPAEYETPKAKPLTKKYPNNNFPRRNRHVVHRIPQMHHLPEGRKWLEAQGVSLETRHIKDNPPTAAELGDWHSRSGLPLKRFFNTSGQKYKELG